MRRGGGVGAAARLAGAFVGLAMLSPACVEPTADIRAVWVSQEAGVELGRRIHVWDAGVSRVVESDLPAKLLDDTSFGIELDPQARGVLVMGRGRLETFDDDTAEYIDLVDSRRVRFPVAPNVSFTPAGDAIWWKDDEPEAGLNRIQLVPLDPSLDRVATSFSVETGTPFSTIDWRFAPDAPVMFGFGFGPAPEMTALRYPEFELLGRAHLPVLEASLGRAVTPSGTTVLVPNAAIGAGPCRDPRLHAWVWDDDQPTTEPLPDVLCGLNLRGALGPDTLLFVGGDGTTKLYHRTSRRVEAVLPLAADATELWVDGGRALMRVSPQGPVHRVDVDGPRTVNAERTFCDLSGDTRVSPRGSWALWTCHHVELLYDENDQFVGADLSEHVVVRVSALGLERHVGVPMSALAIDDAGRGLLVSYDHDGFGVGFDEDGPAFVQPVEDPRALFVLSGDGELARVDDLEPTPRAAFGARIDHLRRFHAQAVSRP